MLNGNNWIAGNFRNRHDGLIKNLYNECGAPIA